MYAVLHVHANEVVNAYVVLRQLQVQTFTIPYIYKFSRDVNFAVFADNLSSTLNPRNFIKQLQYT